MKLKPCKYCDEHAIEMNRCPDTNPMEPVRILCTKCNFQVYGATEEEAIERWNKEYDLVHKPKGVMIMGVELPKKCCECFCCNIRYAMDKEHNWVIDFAECNILKRTATRTKRPSWCPLQEVK